MASKSPEVIIRFGSHAEKEYVLKLAPFLDGLIVGANLLQATPGATASLFVKIGAKDTKLYIDPMTYAYGAYRDTGTGMMRTDLDWIKSEQIRKDADGNKQTVRDFKSSYRTLAEMIGSPLDLAITSNQAVSPISFLGETEQVDFCRNVSEYQLNRIGQVFQDDPELSRFLSSMPQPAVVFAPYFYIEPSHSEDWLVLNLQLMQRTSGLGIDKPVHGILCADKDQLQNDNLRTHLLDTLPSTGVAGLWLWFSGFFEDTASQAMLHEYRKIVEGLSNIVEVYAMHGGFFSLALSKYGMRGISHGVGYGEQKSVIPVIGQSMPTVRYYFPPLAKRLGVPDIELALDAIGIKTPEDFHEKVCDCAVCRGVISDSLDEFSSFGDTHFSRPDSKRAAQTPAAAKRCRFHFLLRRLQERDYLRQASIENVVDLLGENMRTWSSQPSLSSTSNFLNRWIAVLSST